MYPSYFHIILVRLTVFLQLGFHGLANAGRMNVLKAFAGFGGMFQTAQKPPHGLDLNIKNTEWLTYVAIASS